MQVKIIRANSVAFRLLAGSIPFLLGVYIAINPFPHKTAIENISFYASFLFAFILYIAGKKTFHFRNPLTPPFALFTAWVLVGLIFALDRQNGIHDFYAHLVQYLIFLYLVVNFFPDEKRLSVLIGVIVGSSTVFALWALIYFYAVQGFSLDTKLGLVSIDELSSNIIGTLTLFPMILTLGWLIRHKTAYGRAAALACLAILGVATLATMARSALIAMVVSLAVMAPLIMKNRRISTFLAAFLLLALLIMPVRDRFSPSDLMAKLKRTDRLKIALNYIEIVKDYPIAGIGFGMEAYGEKSLLEKYNARLPARYQQPAPAKAPHNSLIDVAVRTGLVGLAIFLYAVYAFVKMALGLIRKGRSPYVKEWGLCLLAAFAALFTQSLFENTLSGPPAIALYLVMGMMTVLWHMEQKPDSLREANQT
jgi:putative inorganic carbon (hco3(-)) transporter